MDTTPGADDPDAWNDAHLKFVYFWLTRNDASPYKGAPTVLLTAMKIEPVHWDRFKQFFNRTHNRREFRLIVRRGLTQGFKNVLAGLYEVEILKRCKLGYVRKFTIKPAVTPRPLSCPQFYRGSIAITTKGLRIMTASHDCKLAALHDPEGRARLTNPFGNR
jgi:hypothetical protein